ncbi:MAG TPA: c-type cytochrome biogenesis protein CcmI [Xanthobacteraceae bacterium]|nr:c-type cytochrome biogenesis protein CcmI [Xanthobacteraceae bacterium]
MTSMFFWISLAGMTAAAVLAVLWPLSRKPAFAVAAADGDAAIYRDQLAEIERDRARGLLAGTEADAMHTEVARRLLAASARTEPGASDAASLRRRRIASLLALLVIATRELWAVFRLAKIEHLQKRAVEVLASDNRHEGKAVVGELLSLTRAMPALARARSSVEGYTGEIIDGADLVRLAEREMMSGLDAQARVLVSSAAKRVSLVTAISPRAAVDMIFVFANMIFLIRKLATLYGGRPGLFGMLRLMRHVISHLALTGGMAIGDSIVQQVLGQGLAAKLSARLGEGVLNGLLTARLGIAAIEVTRPLPFAALPRPKLSDLAGNLLPKKGE